MILESILTTRNPDGSTHLAPMGLHVDGDCYVAKPYRPSRTLENLQRSGAAVVNRTDDVRIFAGCLTGRRDWPLVELEHGTGARLADALSHCEVRVDHVDEDDLRPSFSCKVVSETMHRPFRGFNRAQAAVIELAILVSRLQMLPPEKIEAEIGYLTIAVDKTASPREREAWGWLMQEVEAFRAGKAAPA